MFETREITAAEAAKIIATEEGHFADVKDIRIKPAKLSKSVSGFASASGGEIFLGVQRTSPTKKAVVGRLC
jgi:ATP-dependent DNA helicase RecG